MNTREQFGKFLLLKKLTEDPMGETFRAGLLGGQGMERVALLRIFNGQGLDGNRLWQAVEGRVEVQGALKSPNIGEGIELGQLEGIPFAAYDYVSGKNMANLLEQAARKRNFIPAEHALLIAERIALALASAAETRMGGQRILHGFLVPHLVIISNEGETRLLGFDVGPGLRSFSQNPVIRQHFGRYLAPEALAGAAPDKADDIYSLGVILFELLTGRPLPPPGPDGFASVIQQGVVATEGTPIAPELAALLEKSLVAKEHRIQDVVTWHKTLNQYMFEGQYNPTTFNLAFFMHNLFRQEIERESQEIEVEKTLPVPTVQEKREATNPGVEAPPVPMQAPPGEGTHPGDRTATGTYTGYGPPPDEGKKSKAGLIGGLIAALLVVGAAVGWFMTQGGDADKEATTTQAPAPQPVAPPPPAEPEYTGPTPEELQAQIAELVSQKSDEFKAQYNEQLKNLESQLATAQKEAEDRKRREAERLQKEQEEAEAEAEQARLDEEARLAEEARLEQEALEAEAAAEEARKQEEAEAAAAKVAPAPVLPKPKPTEKATTTQPKVRRGDLVEPGTPGLVMPSLDRLPPPRYPEMARRFNKSGATVVVRVLVDENGKVLKTELAGKEQKFGFDTEALSAARKSQWTPGTKDGVPVKVWHTLSIEFRE